MGTKTPSKYLSLKYLKDLQGSYYYCNQKDFEPSEVDALIYWKQNKLDQIKLRKDEWAEYWNSQFYFKSIGAKMCSHCFSIKKVSDFHTDNSKSFFKLRSWCKKCRKNKLDQK